MTVTTTRLPTSREPVTVAACLDWLHETLPWPRAPRGWQADSGSGFATPAGSHSAASWRECEQCGGSGKTRRGPCANCAGGGGWHFDPMDEKRAALRSSADAHPERDAPVVRIVRLSSQMGRDQLEAAGLLPPELPAPLAHVIDGLEELRRRDPYQRAILQRVHVIRLDPLPTLRPRERDLYDAALLHLSGILPASFRVPPWLRQRAARALTGLHR